jgi:hypothetical protein
MKFLVLFALVGLLLIPAGIVYRKAHGSHERRLLISALIIALPFVLMWLSSWLLTGSSPDQATGGESTGYGRRALALLIAGASFLLPWAIAWQAITRRRPAQNKRKS